LGLTVADALDGTGYRLEVTTMDVPINADVQCADGPCGQSTYVILNPATRQVTHLVVKESTFPYTERLVSIDQVMETDPHLIRLRCTGRELAAMEAFIETEFLPTDISEYGGISAMMWPYVLAEGMVTPVEHEHIPAGELVVRRGAGVEATDGHAGRVDEFLVDPANGHITHLVLREGHLWGQKDVTIPVAQIESIEDGTVYLKLDKESIGVLPAIPIRRR
jgi:sporulation protein YlmC with PRC-barrel domain